MYSRRSRNWNSARIKETRSKSAFIKLSEDAGVGLGRVLSLQVLPFISFSKFQGIIDVTIRTIPKHLWRASEFRAAAGEKSVCGTTLAPPHSRVPASSPDFTGLTWPHT